MRGLHGSRCPFAGIKSVFDRYDGFPREFLQLRVGRIYYCIAVQLLQQNGDSMVLTCHKKSRPTAATIHKMVAVALGDR
jgi:hypothetical protein